MKMKEIVSESEALKIQEKECLLCKTHELAYKSIPDGIVCPYCNINNPIIGEMNCLLDDLTVVGLANYFDLDQEINKYPVLQCGNCGKYSALIPEKIGYNANHDIYYTGGKDYLGEDDENKIFLLAQKKIEASLRQWSSRILAGEKLDEFYPALWMKRDITHAIAEYLFEKGLKK